MKSRRNSKPNPIHRCLRTSLSQTGQIFFLTVIYQEREGREKKRASKMETCRGITKGKRPERYIPQWITRLWDRSLQESLNKKMKGTLYKPHLMTKIVSTL